MLRAMRSVESSIEALVAGASERTEFTHPDGKSEVPMERVVIDGERFILKHLDVRADWIMRTVGDLACLPIAVWRLGLLDALPDSIDPVMVGAAWDGRKGAILMHDVGQWLLPEGDGVIEQAQHERFLDHMAELHASMWGWRDEFGLGGLGNRYLFFHRRLLPSIEASLGTTAAVPTKFVPEGWARFEERVPQAVDLIYGLQDDPSALLLGLTSTPQTFVHGDWKAGNLGAHADGRTILLDWQIPGEAPPLTDAVWYVCLNRARLPEPKDAALDTYRAALERHGVDTEPWWDKQVGLCLLGALVQFGWEKALGEDDELAWWVDRALDGARYLA